MTYASISAITLLHLMHRTLHDELHLHCEMSLEFFKAHGDSSRVTRLLQWTLGNESESICYRMSGRQSTCCTATERSATVLHIHENYLHKSYGSVSAEWNMYVWKQLGNMENDMNISGGAAHFCYREWSVLSVLLHELSSLMNLT